MRSVEWGLAYWMGRVFEAEPPIYEFTARAGRAGGAESELRSAFAGLPYMRCYVGGESGLGGGVEGNGRQGRWQGGGLAEFEDESVPTALWPGTLAEVSELGRTMAETYRVLRPGGLLMVSVPLNRAIDADGADSWRLTPECVARTLNGYGASVVGYQGYERFPHTVVGVAIKEPVPRDFAERARRIEAELQGWLADERRALGLWERLMLAAGRLHPSRNRRVMTADRYRVKFTIWSAGTRCQEPEWRRAAVGPVGSNSERLVVRRA